MRIFHFSGTVIVLMAVVFLLQSCEAEVELAAPYKSTPVIIAVLDPGLDTQFVRINRTFLSERNPERYSAIRDSVEYADGEVDAWLIKYNGQNIVDSVQLQPIDLPSREPGVFYDTDVRFYITDQPLLTEAELNASQIGNMSYEMRATLRGVTYRARTDFPSITLNTLSSPAPAQINTNLAWVSQGIPTTVRFEYTTHPSGGRYQGDLVLVYEQERTDGSMSVEELVYPAGAVNTEVGVALNARNFNFPSIQWFTFAGIQLRQIPNLQRARMLRVEYRLSVSNRDLNAYMSVVSPQSQFQPLFTTFSNFNNDAIGILGTKQTLVRPVFLNQPTMVYFNNSEASGDIPFCTAWNVAGFYCP